MCFTRMADTLSYFGHVPNVRVIMVTRSNAISDGPLDSIIEI